MSFSPRNRVTIRTDLLDAWSSRFSAVGKQIDTRSGTIPFRLADGLAMVVEKLEAWAGYLVQQILPDRAEEAFLDRHGEVEGVTRDPAVAAVLTIRVNGTPSTLITFGSATYKTQVTGAVYRPTVSSATTSGAGFVDVDFVAAVAGSAGNQPAGTLMTWSATPVGATATGTVQDTVTPGAERETDASYAARIIQRRQERPASGNRADWKDWVEQVTGVDVAYVYPLEHGAFGPETLGSVTVVALGPAQGSGVVNTRILSGPKVAQIEEFIEGLADIDGNAVTDGEQLRPVTIDQADYFVLAAIESLQSVAITLTLGAGYSFAWPSATTYVPSGYDNTTKVLSFASDPVLAAVGQLVAIRETGAGASRGAYRYGKIAAVNHGAFTVTLEDTFSSTTVDTTASGRMRPLPSSAAQLRDAIFAYFDDLGPGDSTGDSARWPDEATQGRATVYRNALAAAVIGVGGVLDATVNNPAGTVTPAFKELVTLNELTFL